MKTWFPLVYPMRGKRKKMSVEINILENQNEIKEVDKLKILSK
mgnify:CR=1 FL=1